MIKIQYIIYLSAFYFIYSFLGWVLESVAKTVTQKTFVNSGFLYGPFCPIYGIGSVIMILILNSYKGHYVTTFMISIIIFTIWEYFVGWLLEKMFNTKYWDYSQNRFHIKGRVCLINSLIWGVLGVLFTEAIHPAISSAIYKLPVIAINISTLILIIYMIIDFIITATKMKNINLRLARFSEISETIKEKLEELKTLTEKASKKAKNKEMLQNLIEDLKRKQYELKEKLDKQTNRLKRAFPSMKSEKINEFLNKKIDLKKDKE